MSAPFTIQSQPGTDTVTEDATGSKVPLLTLLPRTVAPGIAQTSLGAVLAADPTMGWPVAYSPQGDNLGPVIDGEPGADWNGFLGWTFDPAGAGASTILTTSGTVYLMQVRLFWKRQISKVGISITVAGATLTANRNFLGLYDSAGNQLGVTADQTTAFASAGLDLAALTSPVTCPVGTYYVAVLATGTTLPTLQAGAALNPGTVSVGNLNLTAATGRWLVGPAAQTALPATIALGSQSLNAAATWWACVA